ncbi:hypothetical protein ACIA8E_32585 [Streptomyces sp. NPDC051664]|uniref:MmyB family transcriptional regulator n=1 Tax=Streptomyces sp. NPDC051664 TaxID=3365668 RepID=UPI0037AB6620
MRSSSIRLPRRQGLTGRRRITAGAAARHDVSPRGAGASQIDHPQVRRLELRYKRLLLAGTDGQLLVLPRRSRQPIRRETGLTRLLVKHEPGSAAVIQYPLLPEGTSQPGYAMTTGSMPIVETRPGPQGTAARSALRAA